MVRVIWCEGDAHIFCPQHAHAPYWLMLHNTGAWTAAIHIHLSVMAPAVTLNAMRASGWEEHQLQHVTLRASGVRMYPPARVSFHFPALTYISVIQTVDLIMFVFFPVIQCETIRALSLRLSMDCSHPLGNFSFGSQCLFTCKEGYILNGTEVLNCSSTGLWNDRVPTCTGNYIFFYWIKL